MSEDIIARIERAIAENTAAGLPPFELADWQRDYLKALYADPPEPEPSAADPMRGWLARLFERWFG